MNTKKALAWILIVCLVCGNYLPTALADDSDIFGSNIEPNVMLLLDSSGSMNDTVGTPIAYNPNQSPVYAQITRNGTTFNPTTVYRRWTSGTQKIGGTIWICTSSSPCYTVYNDNVDNVNWSSGGGNANGKKASFLKTGSWTGRISGSTVTLNYGNYLNYFWCSSCDGIEKKIDIAKRVLLDLVEGTSGVRFGLMKFENNGSQSPAGRGSMVAEIGTAPATIITAVNSITASGFTPTGEQMDDGGRYYKHQALRNGSTYADPIQYSCQPNFIILISDGLWNGSVNPVTEATNRFTQDHHTTFTGLQNVLVHTVGFSLNPSNADEKQALADLQTMAKNGGGSFYTANNSAQLELALQDAISQILAANFSFATPTIPTTGTSGASRAYLASFQSNTSRPFWKGFLKAYSLVNGSVPVDSVTHLPSGTPIWDAGQQLSLKSASSRAIKTYTSSLQDFVTTNSNITAGLLGAANSTEKDQIINYIRGAVDYNDEDTDGNTSEARPWKLGDIFHSTPTLVSPPFSPFIKDSTYDTFKTTNASRTTILLAGANDGMIHAFKESDGAELWAFIPPNLLDQLKNLKVLTGNRDYYVDASPIAADVKTGSPATWKTIVMLGERRGGNKYYALDVTDTINPPLYLWSFGDTRLGETWSEPAIGKVKMSDGTDKWVAFFGGGYDTANANYSSGIKTTEAFFAIDLSNGAKLWEYYNDGTADDRQYMNFSIPAGPTAVDLNNDGYIDRVYIGDVGGQLWKFDVAPTGGATLSGSLINNWTGKRLFAAAPSPGQANPPVAGEFYPTQAIYSRPTLAFDANRNLWIFFGTGDRFHPNNPSTNRFYGIKENTTMANASALTESSLTNTSGGTGSVSQGWYLVFSPPNSGEKVLAAAEVFNSDVFFTSFTPVTTVACGTGGGNAKLYSVNMDTGDAALNLADATVLLAGQSALTNTKTIGTGIPSKPVLVMSSTGTFDMVTSTTSEMIFNTNPGSGVKKALVGWREVFQ